ncbi:hypothetical protein JW977_02550 [Candidatus Falkowbacteria bacterium]|nr:hypothetical protein [Candidatus Falkowbacteria bacterium]
MSGANWSKEDSEKYDQMALDAIERAICYKRNGKIFLLLIFRDENSIEYVRDEMAFMLDNRLESLVEFADLPSHIHKESLLVETPEKKIPQKIAIYCIPSKTGFQTKKEKNLPIIEHVLEERKEEKNTVIAKT